MDAKRGTGYHARVLLSVAVSGESSMKKYLIFLLWLGVSSFASLSTAQSVFDANLARAQGPLGVQSGPAGEAQSTGLQGSQSSTGSPPATGVPQSIFISPNLGGQTVPGATSITNRSRGIPGSGRDVGSQESQGGQQLDRNETILQDSLDRLQYQNFVLQATGLDLPLFGSTLFRNNQSTFAPALNIPVTPDYVIGPGDEIQINAWGQIDVDYSVIVDRNGTINVPKVGVLNVSNLRYQDLPGFLKTAFGRVFRNFELMATLGRLRSIQIFVVGQARRPGTHTVSSLSTIVTALFAVGGPSSKGSMRNIQLKRGNAIIANLDLYDLLVSGDKSKDVRLLPGDVIYIPPIGPVIAMHGSVNVPAIFELKQEATLAEALNWAGGLATTAQGQKVTVERIDQRRTRSVDEFQLDSQGLQRRVRDGDLVTVYAVSPRFDNAITLRGNVAQPGRFPWRQGMRITDLLPSREALLSRDYWQMRSQIVGMDQNAMRIVQQQENAGTRLSVSDLAERPLRDDPNTTIGETIRIRQIERDASRFVLEQSPRELAGRDATGRDRKSVDTVQDRSRLLSQIATSLKEVNWEYALVERFNPVDLTTSLVPFNLGKAVLENDPQQNLLLQSGDVVTIFSREDLQVPQAKQHKFILLEGEVVAPGLYQVQPGETLRQLIVRVGGFTSNAYPFGAGFTRESTRQQQQRNLDEVINRLERDVQRASISRAQNIISAEEAGTLVQQAESQRALVARLRQMRATGRIVLELPEFPSAKDLPDLSLEDGDRFNVPAIPSMVSVFGAVYAESSFIYRPEKRVSDYLSQAGGPTKDADRDSVYILRADGSVISRRQSAGFFTSGTFNGQKIMPGDSVVVPEELDKTTFSRNLKDFAQIFYQFGLGAAAIKVLK